MRVGVGRVSVGHDGGLRWLVEILGGSVGVVHRKRARSKALERTTFAFLGCVVVVVVVVDTCSASLG